MKFVKIIAVSSAMLLSIGASAANKVAASEQNTKETVLNPEASSPGERVICRKQEVIGSRLHSKKVCKTQAQWDYEQKEQRQTVEKGQQQRTLSNSG